VVVDEAYYEYAAVSQAPAGGHVDARGLVEEFPNVLVLRTFSKAYAMAGLRVGYAFGSAELIGDLRKSALPFGVNHVAQAAAVAALDQQDELMRRVRSTVVERDQVVAQARAMGFEVANSSANFYWLPLAEASEEFAAACREAGVLVRAFPGEGVRVTVGEPQANAVVLRQLAAFAGQTS
jgi:histidinol-phosphate aminotransferase